MYLIGAPVPESKSGGGAAGGSRRAMSPPIPRSPKTNGNAPKAVRAVRHSGGRNPISWLIPCHRALANPRLGGLSTGDCRVKRCHCWRLNLPAP